MLGRTIVERKQALAVVRQAFGSLAVLRAKILGEPIERHMGKRSGFGHPNLATPD